MGPHFALGLSMALAFVSAAAPALAQAPDEAVETAAGTTIYDQAFFARYGATNAEDILRRIPGVQAVLDASANQQQDRGFGSGGAQILLGGRRFPGKSNEITTTLRRIPAANIERVELVRGAAADIDVQSEGLVVNIVLKESATTQAKGVTTYEVNARFNDAGNFEFDGLLSYSGARGPLTYSAGYERNLWTPFSGGGGRYSVRRRDEIYYYPNGAVLEVRPQAWDRDHDKRIYTASAAYAFSEGHHVNVNALYQTLHITEIDETPFIRYSAAGAETLRAREHHIRDVDRSEILEFGGEYANDFGPGSLSLLAILSRRKNPSFDFRQRFEPSRTVEVSRSDTDLKTGEDILRGSYTWKVFANQSLEIGAESARNTLDQNLQAFFDTDGDGRLEPIVIPTALAEVQEMRGEAFANHKWTLGPRWSVDSSLTYEFSRLTTNYPFQPDRSLRFAKPRIDARFKPTPSDQIRFLIERSISQLDFANFVPKYNISDDRIEAGNPGLEPEKTWTYAVAYEHRLANDGGVLEARVFYDDITDAIEKVPLVQGGFLTSALGNLPTAERYGIETKASVRLGIIGLPDAVFSLRYLQQRSSTVDPFTGRERGLTSDRQYNLDFSFRHDLTQQKISYGFNYRDLGTASFTSDLLSQDFFTLTPVFDIFVERALFRNTTLRFEAHNLDGAPEYRQRTIFVSDSRNGAVRRLEYFKETRDTRFAIRLRGRF